jgi:hypothetical protein
VAKSSAFSSRYCATTLPAFQSRCPFLAVSESV